MINLTEEQIEEMTRQALEELREGIKESLKDQIIHSAKWHIDKQIQRYVEDFLKDEIGPEIQMALIEQKPAILEACIQSASGLSHAIGEALLASAIENLSKSWGRKKVFEALFE